MPVMPLRQRVCLLPAPIRDTHPNVVNGADINEMSDNTLYVEASVITRLMMEPRAGLTPVQPYSAIMDDLRRRSSGTMW